jgi:hypothetical protein
LGYSVVSVREGNYAVFPTLVKDIFNCPLFLEKVDEAFSHLKSTEGVGRYE